MCFRPAAVGNDPVCPSCGAKNTAGATNCKDCGAELPAGMPVPNIGAPGVPGAPAAPGAPATPGAPKAPGNN